MRRRCAGVKAEHPHGRGEDVHDAVRVDGVLGTPPRAWGGLNPYTGWLGSGRNTPTGVGRTSQSPNLAALASEHPHGRGEDAGAGRDVAGDLGTPPRAWGGPWGPVGRLAALRNTPTGVGRIRARRHDADGVRNTPTGVGRTTPSPTSRGTTREHPHGRGEDLRRLRQRAVAAGTPPRAWGGHRRGHLRVREPRNTPTGVGRTAARAVWVLADSGTPPRAWGGPGGRRWSGARPWNTPTGVGRTSRTTCSYSHSPEHPHGRGEDAVLAGSVAVLAGTPPRAWGGASAGWPVVDNGPEHPYGRGEDVGRVAGG